MCFIGPLSIKAIQMLELGCQDSCDYFAVAKVAFLACKIFRCCLYSVCELFRLSLIPGSVYGGGRSRFTVTQINNDN